MTTELPNELEPVLAKITHQSCLDGYYWYEVVFYVDGIWCSYLESNTFDDGQMVIEWVHCDDVFNDINK